MDCVADESVAEPLERVDDGDPVVLDQHAFCDYVDVASTEVVHDPRTEIAGDGDGPSL